MMRWPAAVVLFCALLLAMGAAAQETQLGRPPQNYGGYQLPESPRSTPPRYVQGQGFTWLVRPATLPFTLFFPNNAQEQGVAGFVLLECDPRADQRLDCEVTRETPQGWGFGASALAMSRSLRVQPNMRNGRVIGHPRVRLPINFRLEQADNDPNTFDLPTWEAAPNADAVRAAWPEAQSNTSTRGRAVLNCTVNADRTLNCGLLRESQEGLGLGRAAMALVSQFRVAEFDDGFMERHQTAPFLLPVNFGFAPIYEPVNRFTAGDTPIHFETPPPMIMQAIYPRAAREANITGAAVVTCTIHDGNQTAADCAITSETPEGHGFGAAALTLANTAMAVTPFEEALPGDQVEFRVPFDLPAPSAPPAH